MMRYAMRFSLLTLLLLASFATLVAVHAQDATPAPEPLRVGTSGLLADDGSVFYSVLLGSNHDTLSNLTISSTLPEGTTFADAFWTPESATFVGEADGVVTWTLPELAADTIIGPFTYQVTFEDSEAAIPAHITAAAQWSEGEVNAEVSDGELTPYADSGSLTVDGAGTEGLVPVADTGVYLLVPPGAFDQPVTFTFERQAINEDTNLPPVPEGESIWWCTLFNVTVEPAGVEAKQAIAILYPTRRTLTPGMDVINFQRPPEGEWATWTPTGWVSPSGNYIISLLSGAVPASSLIFSAGVSTKARTTATATSPKKGSGWIDPDVAPWIEPDINP